MSKVIKRKPSLHAVCIDPKKKNALKKPLTKKELEQENKALKRINEALQEEVLALQNRKSIEAVQEGTQTEDEDLLFCEDCEFPAETLYELGEHVGEFHSGHRIPCDFCDNIYLTKKELQDHEDREHTANVHGDINTGVKTHSPYLSEDEGKVSKDQRHNEMSKCKFCDKRFQNKKELMKHNKEKHQETLSSCWNFEAGSCDFEDNCWFKHEKIELDKNRSFNCKKCEQEFKTRAELFKHKKLVHVETVPICTKFSSGNCAYEDSNCWFIHNVENNENNAFEITEERSLLEGLVKHIENLTKRIVEIESK